MAWRENRIWLIPFVAVWVVGGGLLEESDGGRFMDGIALGVYIATNTVLFIATDRLIPSLGLRLAVCVAALMATTALYTLVRYGHVTWWGMAFAAALALFVIGVDWIVRLVRSHRGQAQPG